MSRAQQIQPRTRTRTEQVILINNQPGRRVRSEAFIRTAERANTIIVLHVTLYSHRHFKNKYKFHKSFGARARVHTLTREYQPAAQTIRPPPLHRHQRHSNKVRTHAIIPTTGREHSPTCCRRTCAKCRKSRAATNSAHTHTHTHAHSHRSLTHVPTRVQTLARTHARTCTHTFHRLFRLARPG